MGENASLVDSHSFHRRIATASHAAILMTVFVLSMIYLETVLKPFFIAMGIYFVLKPGADWLSKNNFPVLLSYLTTLLLFILILISTAFFAWTQASDLIDDEDRQEEYNEKLNKKWKALKNAPIVGPAIKESIKEDTGTVGGDLESLGIGSGGSATDLITAVVAEVGTFVTTSITVLFFLIFIIFEAHLLPGRIERAWPDGASERVAIIQTQIEEGINTYFIVKTGCGIGSASNCWNNNGDVRNRLVVCMGSNDIHSELCALYWFINCYNSTTNFGTNFANTNWFIDTDNPTVG